MKTAYEMSKKEIYDLLDNDEIPEAKEGMEFRTCIMLPTDIKHESGYNVMRFVLTGEEDTPIAKGTYGSDVLAIMTMSGFERWHVDCLPCGLLRVFSIEHKNELMCNVSAFEIKQAGSLFGVPRSV